jgi:enolase-phosphatase E1
MVRLADGGVRLVLLDIEGTTTPMAFVHEVLFPYARAHLAAWLRSADSSARLEIARRLAREHQEDAARGEQVPAWDAGDPVSADAAVTAYAHWLMDRDRKSPGLKHLQALIWEQGYQSGQLRGEVYPDVPPAIERWRDAGVATAIYSSGSELAQRRLFQTTDQGDLTPLIVGFFDTAAGSKMAAASYERIAGALGRQPFQVLFVSDVVAELLAAAEAGCQTVLSVRPGNPSHSDAARFASIRSFDEIQ